MKNHRYRGRGKHCRTYCKPDPQQETHDQEVRRVAKALGLWVMVNDQAKHTAFRYTFFDKTSGASLAHSGYEGRHKAMDTALRHRNAMKGTTR